jgi:lipopolysaccharide/colanic/teichoic acid biosynthesis glycosyltransferase
MSEINPYLTSQTKRNLDIVGASALLPLLGLLWPPMRHISKRYCDLGGPYVFTQERTGYLGRPFDIRKFRTMYEQTVEATPGLGPATVPDIRSDKLGNLLRIVGLDETTQVINVLSGDMSLVGPRPLLTEEIDKIVDTASDRYLAEEWREVRTFGKPGVFGPGQFSAHHAESRGEKGGRIVQMRQDIKYIETASLSEDLRQIANLPPEISKLGWVAIQSAAAPA